MLLITNYKKIELFFSKQGIDSILTFLYDLWDSINQRLLKFR